MRSPVQPPFRSCILAPLFGVAAGNSIIEVANEAERFSLTGILPGQQVRQLDNGEIYTLNAPSTAQGGVFVSGGTQDGIWFISGSNDGKPAFYLLGENPDTSGINIAWFADRWVLNTDNDGALYYSLSDVATPDLASDWKNASDDSPASITVTSITQGELDAGVTVSGDGYQGDGTYTKREIIAGERFVYVRAGSPDSDYIDGFNTLVGNPFLIGNPDGESYTYSIGYFAFPWQNDWSANTPAPTVTRNDIAAPANWSVGSVPLTPTVLRDGLGNELFSTDAAELTSAMNFSSFNPATAEIGTSCNVIGSNAFTYCASLSSVTILNSVTSIGANAFAGLPALGSTLLPDSLVSIGSNAFSGCSSFSLGGGGLPGSLTSIGSYAFYGCYLLTSTLVLPETLTSLGDGAFKNCNTIIAVTFPESITAISNRCFEGCASLQDVTLTDSLTSLGSNAFASCASLTAITIPDSVADIGNGAFSGCSFLADVTLPSALTSISEGAFDYCVSLAGITIPPLVTSIGNFAFHNCVALAGIALPGSVLTLGSNAFQNCTSLTDVALGSSLTSIGSYAFYGCGSLANIILPSTLTSIGDSAFAYCSSLTAIYAAGNAPALGSNAFYASSPVIYYHEDATGWTNPWNGIATDVWSSFPDPMP